MTHPTNWRKTIIGWLSLLKRIILQHRSLRRRPKRLKGRGKRRSCRSNSTTPIFRTLKVKLTKMWIRSMRLKVTSSFCLTFSRRKIHNGSNLCSKREIRRSNWLWQSGLKSKSWTQTTKMTMCCSPSLRPSDQRSIKRQPAPVVLRRVLVIKVSQCSETKQTWPPKTMLSCSKLNWQRMQSTCLMISTRRKSCTSIPKSWWSSTCTWKSRTLRKSSTSVTPTSKSNHSSSGKKKRKTKWVEMWRFKKLWSWSWTLKFLSNKKLLT